MGLDYFVVRLFLFVCFRCRLARISVWRTISKMKKDKSPLFALLVVSTVLTFSFACVTLLGEPNTSSAPVFPIMIPSQPENASCPLITERIVDVNSPELTEDTSGTMDFGERDESAETYLVTYIISDEALIEPYYYDDVSADLEDEQSDLARHEEIWNYFSTLIPYESRQHLTEFSIFTDGEDNILAAVAQTYDDAELWGLEMDIADTHDYYYLSFTLVHEFAHLLTLSSSQVPPSLAIFNNPEDDNIYLDELSACSNFFPGEGCSNSDSYINTFYNQFWVDIYEEWNEINLEEDEDLYYEKLDDFYYQYEDQFLTDYAVTHPAEDIAESFSLFIFAEKPAGSNIAEQKNLFFYDYPELVELRTHIINNLCVSFPQ